MLDIWVDVVEPLLRAELANADSGHCLRVSHLPRPILEQLASRLSQNHPAGVEIYLVDRTTGPEPWRVGVHKVVERRNAEEGVVLALFPPDLQLAAGDSVDVSTFRALPVEDLPDMVERRLMDKLSPGLRRHVSVVLEYLHKRGWPVPIAARLEYVATVAAQGDDEVSAVGGALFALGLIPDFALLERPEHFHHRIGQRNIKMVQMLREDGSTPLQRLLRLPVRDESFRGRLIQFFDRRAPDRVTEWGRLVASETSFTSLALDRWPLDSEETSTETLRIDVEPLRLPKRSEDGLFVYDARSKVNLVWHTTPPPIDVPGLEYFRIELVSSDREVAWESALIRNTGGKTARRSRQVKDLNGIESGVYFLRVVALNDAGDPISDQPLRDPEAGPAGKRSNETDDFLLLLAEDDPVEIDDVQAITNTVVSSFAEAELLARASAVSASKDPEGVRARAIAWDTPVDARSETAVASIRFDLQHQYAVRVSQRLRKLELEILAAAGDGGYRRVAGDNSVATPGLSLPTDFADSRRLVFEAIGQRLLEGMDDSSGDDRRAVVALTDLCGLAAQIEDYARSYLSWLQTGDPDSLRLDVVLLELPEEHTSVALMAPTHPLRLLWLLQAQQAARSWLAEARIRKDADAAKLMVDTWRRSIIPQGLPAIMTLAADGDFIDSGTLPGGWGAYVPVHVRDSRATLGLLRRRLGAGAAHQSGADVSPHHLADKLETFLRQHPYTSTLTLNVINPGDAALIVDALIDLERRRAPDLPTVRYQVRLFTDAPRREDIGGAFRDLLDPDRQISETAAQLVAPGRSFLFPKLSWSRNSLQDFCANPDQYPAHITVLLDAFAIVLRVARPATDERSSYVHGLVQEAPRRFAGRGQSFAWLRRPSPAGCRDIPGAPGRSGLLAALLKATGMVQAQVLAPNVDTTDTVASVALELSAVDQSLLYSVHSVSTWVLTIDPNLGLDYFDAAGRSDRPGYLLDFTPEFVASGGRQLLLTTRVGEEVASILAPAASQLGLDPDGPGALMLMEALRSLSGRLALRLLSSPSQVQGALGMALSRLLLEAYDLLDEAIVIPLDAHPELSERSDDPTAPQLRGDILVVTTDPVARQIDFLLVEAKCHAGSGLSSALRNEITAQLNSSEAALRHAFDPQAADPDRIDRPIQTWRLTGVLDFYLERASRYGLVPTSARAELRRFITDLDDGYSLSIRKTGLVFHLEAPTTSLDSLNPDLPIWLVGRDTIDRVVSEALHAFVEHDSRAIVSAELQGAPPARSRTMADDDTWDDVRRTFAGPRMRRLPERTDQSPPILVAAEAADSSAQGSVPNLPLHSGSHSESVPQSTPALPATEQAAGRSSDEGLSTGTALAGQASTGDAPPTSGEDLAGEDGHAQHSGPANSNDLSEEPASAGSTDSHGSIDDSVSPDYSILIGDTKATPQFGLIGSHAAEPWRKVAVDLNGCNTISVFGVQGSGKSYTVGSVVEMATRSITGLNLLPKPLGAVVFHYHQTQDYAPEFVSMNRPNDDAGQVEALAQWDTRPVGLDDVLVLTTADTIDLRRSEFPDITVEPISFASSELTVADWRFLMGASGNDALYLKLLNEVMRKSRSSLTLDGIREGIATAPFSDAQRVLAETRLEFAARFIDDSRSLRSLLRPGRLVVVDLRDEFVEKEQALGLFVTMLNIFSGAGLGGEAFNKLIVFDEAHKYMGGALITQVVEIIREMRHKGVSIMVASQDPINVPPAVIELSSAVVLHRFNAPSWLRHIQRSLAALSDLTSSMLSSLSPGEAFIWANKSTDPTFTRRAVKVRMRPRATKHGGSTRLAIED